MKLFPNAILHGAFTSEVISVW